MQKDGEQCPRKRWKGQVREISHGAEEKMKVNRSKNGQKGCVQGMMRLGGGVPLIRKSIHSQPDQPTTGAEYQRLDPFRVEDTGD